MTSKLVEVWTDMIDDEFEWEIEPDLPVGESVRKHPDWLLSIKDTFQ